MDLDRLQALADAAAEEGPSPGGPPPEPASWVPTRRKKGARMAELEERPPRPPPPVLQVTWTPRPLLLAATWPPRPLVLPASWAGGPSGMGEQEGQAAGGLEGGSQGAPHASSSGAHTQRKRAGSTSRYIGVGWGTANSAWNVAMRDPQTKRSRHIGTFSTEEAAARAYDCAAVQAHGAAAKRNFPGEDISELLAAAGEGRKHRGSSLFVGVSWNKSSSSWTVQLVDPQTKRNRHFGSFNTEEDAARAYDCAAVQMHGPGAKRNFPGEDISELLVAASKKKRGISRYTGISWNKANASWEVRVRDPETKRQRYMGCCASEEDAARAYDRAAVQAHGPDAKRNFPGEALLGDTTDTSKSSEPQSSE
ncbi:hypothetical protein FOA52_012887 [Chlamydomonas sp. UWO 241]|nr:hypothetical protein FOA52_012887 [Chlamydomonas sp. UWO 241]